MTAMRKTLYLLGLLIFLAAGLLVLEGTRETVDKPAAPQMLEATARTRQAFDALREERIRRGLPMDAADDPNDTGMIGPVFTDITTTLGALDAKRSTTNPNVAAMLVDMFDELGIGAGDRIAVNLSGSFPCLNIAMLCTMDTLGIEGTVLFSVGASTYGATIPEFTYGDMEHFLYTQGLISTHSIGFSMGGQDDLGLEMPEALRGEIAERLSGYGYEHLAFDDLGENLNARTALYDADGPVRCFVNVGGNLLSFGESGTMHTVPGGILRSLPVSETGDGLVQRYLGQDVPVIQLLNMKGLLPRYGLPIDPVPVPPDGAGGVYRTEAYRQPALWAVLVAGMLGVGGIGLWERKKRRAERREDCHTPTG